MLSQLVKRLVFADLLRLSVTCLSLARFVRCARVPHKRNLRLTGVAVVIEGANLAGSPNIT